MCGRWAGGRGWGEGVLPGAAAAALLPPAGPALTCPGLDRPPSKQRLLAVAPFLQQRLIRMRPKLIAALAADPERVAARLIALRALLPGADVAAVAGGRPSLLLDPEWGGVEARAAGLAAVYSEAEVARLVAAEPLLLAEDLEAVLAELQR